MIGQKLKHILRRSPRTLFFIVFAIVCMRSNVSFSDSNQYSADYIIESLKKIAFSAELAQGDEEGYIRKWRDRVNYIILGEPDNKKIDYIIRFIRGLSSDIGFEAKSVYRIEEANSIVFLADSRDQLKQYLYGPLGIKRNIGNNFECAASVYLNDDFEIVFSQILIPAYVEEDDFVSCVDEEFAQALGLQNDADIKNSMFNDYAPEIKSLTRFDRCLLELLYQKEIVSGMDEHEAESIWRNILKRGNLKFCSEI